MNHDATPRSDQAVPIPAVNPPDAPVSRGQRSAGLAATIALVLLGAWTLRDFLPALIWAAIFAIVIWPLYRRAQHRWPARAHGHALPLAFTLVVALVFILPLAFVVVPVTHEVHDLITWVNEARRTGVAAPAFLGHLPWGNSHLVPLWHQYLSDPAQASALLGRIGRSRAVTMSGHVGSEVLHRLVLFGFTLLTLFFLFRDGEAFVARLLTASRRAFGPGGESVGRQVIASVHGTLDGLVLVGIGEGVVLGIVYVFAGVPRPFLFGVVTALCSMVPFGAALAFWIAGLVLLAAGHTVNAIIVVAAGLVVTFIADHFVRPVLIGGATRLPFLWVLLGILGGIESFGLLGLFVGPAVMAVLILLWREWVGDQGGPINPQPRAR